MSLTLWTNRLIFFYIWITILSYLPFLNSLIIVSLLVKCSMGRRAKGSCTLWRTFNQLFIMSRSLVAMSATIIVGTIAMDLVNKTLFHLAHLIFIKPYKMKHLMKIWAFMLLFFFPILSRHISLISCPDRWQKKKFDRAVFKKNFSKIKKYIPYYFM